ncbi:RDD family protein [Lihuaxuella thermophila]|uniref:Uncharacterized membrane protein YckC, RDD family n=1 Tax=Lihuaxuella thermophila TaxID=1173111 RepID=A0A1H8FFT9_9BACL|nr:RDD family protein [Lihuaxuella thermophila]SEN30476.1 Uncharacterized membrane protein YckC, RDD family [Lihuaxuella thermophila]
MKNFVIIHTPEHVQIPFSTAGIGTRALAKIIDFFCMGTVMFPLGMFGMLISEMVGQDDMPSILLAIIIFVLSAIPLAYFTCTEYWMKGQTIGKRVMNLRVIQDNGGSPGFLAVFLRNLLQLADLLPGFYLLGMVTIFIHRQEKRLGDIVAGTLVIYEHKKPKELVLEYSSLFLRQEEIEIFKRLAPISGDRFLVLESFLLRRHELHSRVRNELAVKLVQTLWPEIQTDSGHEEAFLEKIYLYLRNTAYLSDAPKLISGSFPVAS